MTAVTQILQQIDAGNASAADHLLPLVYDELRKMAASRMAAERADHTLQATALVHEAYVRLVDTPHAENWNGRGHFFAAAAEAMRRILVENARARRRAKRGGNQQKLNVNDIDPAESRNPELVLAIHDALEVLSAEDEQLAELVKLRSFAGFSLSEAAELLNIGQSTAYEHWTYAKSRLRVLLGGATTE